MSAARSRTTSNQKWRIPLSDVQTPTSKPNRTGKPSRSDSATIKSALNTPRPSTPFDHNHYCRISQTDADTSIPEFPSSITDPKVKKIIEQLRAKLLDADAHISLLKEDNEKLTDHLRQVADSTTLASLAVPQTDPKLLLFKKEVDQLRTEIVLIRDRMHNCMQRNAELEQQNIELENLINDLRQQNQEQSYRISNLCYSEYEAQSLSSQLEESRLKSQELSTELMAKEAELSAVKVSLASLQAKIIQKEEEFRRSLMFRESQEQSKLKAKNDFDPDHQQLKNVISENKTLKFKLTDLEKDNSRLNTLLKSNQELITISMQKQQNLQENLDKERINNQELTSVIAQLKQKIQDLESRPTIMAPTSSGKKSPSPMESDSNNSLEILENSHQTVIGSCIRLLLFISNFVCNFSDSFNLLILIDNCTIFSQLITDSNSINTSSISDFPLESLNDLNSSLIRIFISHEEIVLAQFQDSFSNFLLKNSISFHSLDGDSEVVLNYCIKTSIIP
ncbi:hypothetical protein RCL1_005488 [Eukaryota sp. TZLM3-RCL]